jgi:hypothetical protein
MDVTSDLIKIFGGAGFGILAAAWMAQMLVKSAIAKDVKDFEIRLKSKADGQLAGLADEYRRRADAELAALNARLSSERDLESRSRDVAAAQRERIRAEILRWSNPIRGAVLDLKYRLRNILEGGGYAALQPTPNELVPKGWSIDYAYFLPSTLYVFCQYFHWVRRLEVELGFDLFADQQDKDTLIDRLNAVSDALGEWWDEMSAADDRQVFRLQQRALGECLLVRDPAPRCLDYPEFLMDHDAPPLETHLVPLVELIDGLEPKAHPERWARLQRVLAALDALDVHTQHLLRPAAVAAQPTQRGTS